MKKLFTIDDFMIAFISASGYGAVKYGMADKMCKTAACQVHL